MRHFKRILVCLITALFMVLMAACQPTPDQAVVVNKGDGKLEGIIAGPTAAQQTIMPEESGNKEDTDAGEVITYTEQWKETYTLPNLVCDINADVILPAANEYPVFKMQQHDFDTETLGKIVDYFTQNATGVRETSDTKEELEELLIQTKKGVYMMNDDGGKWESYDGQEQDIANLEDRIRNAKPETFDPITDETIAIPMKKTYGMPDNKRVHVDSNPQKIRIAITKFGTVQPESWVVAGEAYPGEPKGTTIDNVKISEDEAKKEVYDFLAAADIKSYGIAETEKARILDQYTYEHMSEGWLITLTRNDGNIIPVYIDATKTSGLFYYKPDEFTYRWPYEYIRIYVDENGIQSFDWENPTEVVKEMNSNVPIIGFDDAKERIRQYMKFAFAKRTEGREILEQHITMNKIVLTNVLAPIKDEPDYHMFVPAWVVYYDQVDGLGQSNTSVLALNAIDGSNIDLVFRPQKG